MDNRLDQFLRDESDHYHFEENVGLASTDKQEGLLVHILECGAQAIPTVITYCSLQAAGPELGASTLVPSSLKHGTEGN